MYDFKENEQRILKFWNESKIYEKVKVKNKKGKKFYFLQGPPYTSGNLHIGTAWNNCLKDMIMRYKRMRGFNVWDRAGYDTHGLPTENRVRKKLNLKYKEDIHKYGVDKFVKECRKVAEDGAKNMSNNLWNLGVWMDFKDPYMTLSKDYIEGEWFFIKKAWEQKRIYKDKKILHWCSDCETGLAKHELEYKNVNDDSIFLRFKIKGKKNEYLIVWTTTPWTIPYNLAVMVNPELDYVKLETEDKDIYYISKALAHVVLTSVFEKKYNLLEEFKGDKLLGLEYENPFNDELKNIFQDMKKKYKNLHTVILSEKYVDTSAGSGLVHCAPGCGPEDKEVGDEYNLPSFNNLDEKGSFENMKEFNGMVAKKDDQKFIDLLKKKGVLLKVVQVEHEYPHCWRCHNPVVFRAVEQWFLKIKDITDKLVKENEKVLWIPDFGKASYNRWTENLKDNSIVRQRFWGCPNPIWKCNKCDNIEVIGNTKELKKKAGKIPDDLHIPFIDEVKWKCDKCNGTMIREPDIVDIWIDSGTAGWNCLYYPGREDYFKEFFPADFILEATEQVRLWFSMLNICSIIALGKKSYNSVYMHGMILDWEGGKMSKSLGNVISPDEVIEKSGVDVFRYYLFQNTAGENMNFNWEELKIKQRNINVLWNIKNYLIELSSLLGKNPSKLKTIPDLEEKYIISRCNSTIKEVTDLFEKYQLDSTVIQVENLFLELSRVYMQLVRDKANGSDKEKENVLCAIYEVLMNSLKLFSPTAPFITEQIYQELRDKLNLKEESIHLCEWPSYDAKKIDKKIEEEFLFAMQIIEKVLAERSEKGIGVRWPLSKVTVKSDKKLSKGVQEIMLKRINVKKIEFVSSKTFEISLDTKMTKELEEEGYFREIARVIQDSRKKAGLTKDQEISLVINTESFLSKIVEKNMKEMLKKANCKKIEFNKSGNYKNKFDFKIKDKKVEICF
jgi:isoleucyl-tRNA synthetase